MSLDIPPNMKSLYRMFLRACSTSVLHNTRAKRQLRRLWRPSFEAAINVLKECQRSDILPEELEKRRQWLAIWENRSAFHANVSHTVLLRLMSRLVENTAEMLLTSSTSRGLPHQLTRNLSFLHSTFIEREKLIRNRIGQPWNPAPEQFEDVPAFLRKLEKRGKGMTRGTDSQYDTEAYGALEEVVRMAEGTAGLVLGRPTFRRRRP
jgi:hypothetical protein